MITTASIGYMRIIIKQNISAGIFTDRGSITLGCTTVSDFIYVSSYDFRSGGRLNIADGQELFDEYGIS